MTHKALPIVDEFLRSGDAQARKNALTALALMSDDEESVRRLADAALVDPDDGACARAVEEIVSLPEPALQTALNTLRHGLRDEAKGQRAYAALGRLKSLGKHLPKRLPLPLAARLRFAWAMNTFLYPARNLSYRVRALRQSLIGALLSTAILWPFYAIQADWDRQANIIYSILVFLLAALTGVLATQQTTPINLYLDRKAASLVETLASVIFTVPVSLLLLLLAAILGLLGPSDDIMAVVFSLMLGVLVAVGVTRAATILSFGVLRRRRANAVFQVCVAVGTVFLLLAALNFYVWRDDTVVATVSEVPDYYPEELRDRMTMQPSYRIVQALWVCLLPVAFTSAYAFASIDKKSPPVRPIAGRAGVAFGVVTITLSLALLAAIVTVGRKHPAAAVNINATFEGIKALVIAREQK